MLSSESKEIRCLKRPGYARFFLCHGERTIAPAIPPGSRALRVAVPLPHLACLAVSRALPHELRLSIETASGVGLPSSKSLPSLHSCANDNGSSICERMSGSSIGSNVDRGTVGDRRRGSNVLLLVQASAVHAA